MKLPCKSSSLILQGVGEKCESETKKKKTGASKALKRPLKIRLKAG